MIERRCRICGQRFPVQYFLRHGRVHDVCNICKNEIDEKMEKYKNSGPSLRITSEQMMALLSIFSPLIDTFVERVAQRVRQLEEEKEPRYYSRKEVAELLHVTLPTLHAMVNAGALHPKKIGGRVIFDAKVVDEAIRCGKLTKHSWYKK